MKLVCMNELVNHNYLSNIYIYINEKISFPNNEWTDFCIYIIDDWANELENNIFKDSVSFKLYFMEGPYYLSCLKNNDMLIIKGMQDGNEDVFFEEKISYEKFLEMVCDVGYNIINFYNKMNIFNLDIDNLRLRLIRMRKQFHNLKYHFDNI